VVRAARAALKAAAMVEEQLARAWNQLVGRVGGPFTFRFMLQPAVAVFLGIRAGMRDGALLRGHTRFAGTLKDIGRLWVFAFVLDAVYQVIVLRWFYPLQSLLVSVLLALVPYYVARLSARAAARRRGRA